MTPQERRALVDRRDPEKVRAADRARYYREPEKRMQVAREWHEANPERVREHQRRWVEKNPEKRRVHGVVQNAIRTGKLVKGPCERAVDGGCSKRIHAHHDDYSKPLEVRWLCSAHHAATHRLFEDVA